jgi:hypothetical protein
MYKYRKKFFLRAEINKIPGKVYSENITFKALFIIPG